MRMIGHLANETSARTFSNYLYVLGIKNQVEAESDGTWALWIHSEEELDRARTLLRNYQVNPNDPEVQQAAAKAQELKAQADEENTAARKRYFDRGRLFPMSGWRAMGPLTMGLIAVSVIVYLVQQGSSGDEWTRYLLISDPMSVGTDLPEVRQGQVWRLLSPIFLHFHPLHILFNMLWLRDLGTMVERRLGSLQLLLMVLGIGVISNVAQYYTSGPAFGGMSGVVYGLLGYVWIRGRFDPGSGLFLHPSTVMMMLIWLVFGYTKIMSMANTVHTVGLTVGAFWGFIASRRFQ